MTNWGGGLNGKSELKHTDLILCKICNHLYEAIGFESVDQLKNIC